MLRRLAPHLSERALLHRLFGEPLAGGDFPEAADILWQITPGTRPANSMVPDLISSRLLAGGFQARRKTPLAYG